MSEQTVLDAIAALAAKLGTSPPAAVNYCPDPSFETDTNADGLSDDIDIDSGVAGVPVYTRVAGRTGGYAQRIQYTGAGDTNVWLYIGKKSAVGTFLSGAPASVSFSLKGTVVGVAVACLLQPRTAADGYLAGGEASAITVTPDWQQESASIPYLPHLTSFVRCYVQIDGIHTGDTIDITIDDMQIEPTASPTPDTVWGAVSALAARTGTPLQAEQYHPPLERLFDGPWERQGVMLSALGTWDENAVQECAVIRDGATWKMWYHGGWFTGAVGYATAPAAAGPWTPYAGNPVLGTPEAGGYRYISVWKTGTTYHMIANLQGSTNHLTSPDGIAWTLISEDLVPADGNWYPACNTATWEQAGVWFMLAEAKFKAHTAPYNIGLLTAASVDGPWTRYTDAPVIGSDTLSASGPFVIQKDGRYYCWFGGCTWPPGPTGSPIVRASADSPYLWTWEAGSILVAVTPDEGAASAGGQLADVSLVEDDGTLYMFYSAVADGALGPSVIKLATTLPYRLADLAAIKLKTDTLGGAGAIAYPYTLTDALGEPIADAKVWVKTYDPGTGVSGGTVIASGLTDNFGALVPVPQLDAGTYAFFAKKAGTNFTAPDIEVVVAP
jgi:hypothetical protein